MIPVDFNALHEQARREHFLAPARELIRSKRILMRNGHFDFGNGYHGRTYRNAHELIRIPSVIWTIAEALIEIATYEMKNAQVVAGPMLGGAILAHTMAGMLDGNHEIRKHDEPSKVFVPIHHDGRLSHSECGYLVKLFYAKQVYGKSVWLVDDVGNTGQTLAICADLIEQCCGEVAGTSVILQRRSGLIPNPKQHRSIVEFEEELYSQADCPMCKEEIPITRF